MGQIEVKLCRVAKYMHQVEVLPQYTILPSIEQLLPSFNKQLLPLNKYCPFYKLLTLNKYCPFNKQLLALNKC